MHIIKCPSCRRVTNEYSTIGRCEHCGADAMTAGDPIDAEAAEPIRYSEAFTKWRRLTLLFWFAAVMLELGYFLIVLVLSYFLVSLAKHADIKPPEFDAYTLGAPAVLLTCMLIVGIWLIFQPIPASWAGAFVYITWIITSLLIDPFALCATLFRVIVLIALMAGVRNCLKHQ
ncbi:MAG: hypothetical protein HY289_12130 [Planctomycetes bacterium]|nr:hypothetical protein [Planctomycetota bacterium]